MNTVPIEESETQLNYQFRPLNRDDVPTLRTLCKEWFPLEYPYYWYDLVTSEREEFFTLSVTINLKIIGVIVAVIESNSKSEFRDAAILSMPFSKVAYILVLGVVKEYRRMGIATLLIDHLIHHLTSNPIHHNVKAIYLHVLTTNSNAIRLYEKNNFKLHSLLPAYYYIDNQLRDGYCYFLCINGGFKYPLSQYLYPFQNIFNFFNRISSFFRFWKKNFWNRCKSYFNALNNLLHNLLRRSSISLLDQNIDGTGKWRRNRRLNQFVLDRCEDLSDCA